MRAVIGVAGAAFILLALQTAALGRTELRCEPVKVIEPKCDPAALRYNRAPADCRVS